MKKRISMLFRRRFEVFRTSCGCFHALLSVALAGLLVSCSARNARTMTPRERLLARLHRIEQLNGCVFGHHDDPVYGHDWNGCGISDVKAVTGDYPGLMSWDLGLVEYGSPHNLDGVPFDRIRREAIAQHDRGGLNTFSWHLRNPVTGGNSWEVEGRAVRACLTEGSALSDTLRRWIASAADFLGGLRDASGRRIPVIFRPWHEHTGDWFWWGESSTSPEDYKALWLLTRSLFDEKGVDNVVWAYSPDATASVDEYVERYPGDRYVDLLGADIYHFDGDEGVADFLQQTRSQLDAVTALAARKRKPMALTETGSEGVPMNNWFTEVLLPLCERYPLVYVCVWRNAHDLPAHYYTPYPGHPAASDFRRFYESPHIWFARELQAKCPDPDASNPAYD